ncbi:MAG TPA: acetyl-CoA carboxylase biotin carboxyl carrier protein subunit [Bacteroidia bacterium]|nr:acetyl-CoA carboxylase biotin carboxyl carrier protein subunit [Bacteroidia bacterium]
MLKISVNNKKTISIDLEESASTKGKIDGKDFECDVISVKKDFFHAIKNNQSYSVEIIKTDASEKKISLKVNGTLYELSVKDKYDELLHQLGFDAANAKKINEVKAPMPGLVLEILISEGAAIKKGDPIFVLEAMKMENVLKSPADAVVKKINVQKGNAVEKNQVLVQFN